MAAELAVVEVENKALSLRDRVRAITVCDQATHDAAAELYIGLTALAKEIDAVHDPAISAAHAAHKAAIAAKNKSALPVEEAKRIIKPKVTAWETEQERIRQELERKAREEAYRRQQEEERKAREAAEAERKRIAAEEEDARLKLALEAEQMGAAPEQVQEILETPVYVAPEPVYTPAPFIAPTVAPTFQKTAGFTSRWNYSGEVTDIAALCAAVAQNRSLSGYVQGNLTAINSLARATKEAFSLAGCRLKKERV